MVSGGEPDPRIGSATPYGPAELTEAVRGLEDRPLALDEESELSIAGLQDKMLLVELDHGRSARPVHGFPSTHILKVDDRVHPGLVRAEHACLSLARAAGLSAAESELTRIGEVECIIVRRFDREHANGDREQVPQSRIHQEDACQALGIDPEGSRRRAKYEAFGGPSLYRIAALLNAWSPAPEDCLLRLLDHTTFTVAIGNADAHGKNVALLLLRPGRVTLGPLYDTVPTVLWPALRAEAAMAVAGRTALSAITVDDIVTEASRWPIPADSARSRVDRTLERLRSVLASDGALPDSPALALTSRRVDRLLAGQAGH